MKYVIANFKSNKTSQEVQTWLQSYLVQATSDVQVIVALPTPYLHLGHNSTLLVGAQDVSPFPQGSYTGATNASQLADMGVKFCLVGHSERRLYFHETKEEIANKVQELLKVGITPIVCVGQDDIAPQLSTLTDQDIAHCLFAFETMSDIGGTHTSPIDQIKEATSLLERYTNNQSLGILYGGSVNAENVPTLPSLVDGVLVATASLEVASFAKVVTGFVQNA